MRALVLGLVIAALPAGVAQAAVEESTSDRLPDRREVAAGTRAYSVGFEDGRFYANGWHILGEMGGIWTPPLKLADGVWFGVDGQWAGPATKFTSGRGYVGYDLPALSGLNLRRVDFVPDGRRAVVYGLSLANPDGRARTATVMVDVHSELMSAYPWSSTKPSAATDLQDTVTYEDGALVFRDQGTPDGREPHDWAALVASPERPTAHETGDGHRGPQPGAICHDGDQTAPKGCDDGPFGKGTGGQLQYRVTVPARGERTVWIAVAGSDRGLAAAQGELAKAIENPQDQLREKIASRARLASRSRVDLPGDRTLENAVDWGKQNLADLTQTATDLKIRFVDQGKAYPDPVGTVDHATFIGAGYPDYPWMFATDGEYTAFAAVAVGQFEAIKAHLIALRDVSDLLNQRSGKVAHEVVTDGSVYFGANTDDGNTDETVKFPSALALVWRWTGDDRFLDELYDFAVRNLRYVATHLDEDGDGWPEGLGNVERPGMGEEKLDNTVYYIRGLYDLADLARAQHDRATERWATSTARDLQARFDPTWWDGTQYADSLGEDNERIQQRHWIGVTPMSADIAPADHARAALAERETDCYSGVPPYNRGLFHTGCNGGPEGKGERTIFSLNTAIQAVGEGNYGRLGAGQQQRYTAANADPMFEPDEMPGALPEILPSPDFGDRDDNDRNIDRCWSCRAMFMQAWGHYGTAWPVIHQQLGVRPSLGTGELAVVPQIPDGQHWIGGDDIRLGDGSASVVAQRFGDRYATKVALHGTRVRHLRIGVTLPSGARPADVRLDGHRTHATITTTHRGTEVTVRAQTRGRHTLTVR